MISYLIFIGNDQVYDAGIGIIYLILKNSVKLIFKRRFDIFLIPLIQCSWFMLWSLRIRDSCIDLHHWSDPQDTSTGGLGENSCVQNMTLPISGKWWNKVWSYSPGRNSGSLIKHGKLFTLLGSRNRKTYWSHGLVPCHNDPCSSIISRIRDGEIWKVNMSRTLQTWKGVWTISGSILFFDLDHNRGTALIIRAFKAEVNDCICKKSCPYPREVWRINWTYPGA